MTAFNPSDWFWIVGGDESQVYSSAAGSYVQTSNKQYENWLAAGNVPTRIVSEVELGEVLADYDLRPAKAQILDAYKDKQARGLTLAVVAKILFWLVNELQTIKGQPTMTPAQFRAKVKDLM